MNKIEIIKLQPTPVFAKTLNYFARGDYCNFKIKKGNCYCLRSEYDISSADTFCKHCIREWLLEKYNMDLYLNS